MTRLLPAVLLAATALLGGCAPGTGDVAGGEPAPSGTDRPATGVARGEDDLRIEVDPGDGAPAQEWTLTCGASAGGSHPRAADACAHLAGMDDPFAPLPDDLMCTEQYGGPETAHITGRWRGAPVDMELSRVDGCRISQWSSFGPVLPVPVVGEPIS